MGSDLAMRQMRQEADEAVKAYEETRDRYVCPGLSRSHTDFRLGDGIIKTEYLLGDMINKNKENNPFRYPSVRRSIEKAEPSTSSCEYTSTIKYPC